VFPYSEKTASLPWYRSSSTSTRKSPPSKISWTSTMRCSVTRIEETKQTISTDPRMFRTRTQMGELDLCWVSRSELSVRENPVFHSLRLYSLSFIESSY
jgi:hypothetical protein